MDTSLNPYLCKDLYGYFMELCLSLGFSYLLVRNSLTSNNEVDWFISVLRVAIVVICDAPNLEGLFFFFLATR